MIREIRTAVLMLLAMTLLAGLVYPLTVTGLSQVFYPEQARGSLIVHDGQVRGSVLIGQPFTDSKYFWGRPSATGSTPYNAASSSGSNLAVGNPGQLDAIKSRIAALRAADPSNAALVPIDLVTASGSGLDPHISPAAARFQASRVARSRGLEIATVRRLIDQMIEPRQWGVLGEPRVNVLRLNLELNHTGRDSERSARHSLNDPS